MNLLSVLDWPARVVLGALVVGAIGGGVFLFVRTSGDDDPQAAAQLIETPTPTATTVALATLTPTALPSTATVSLPAEPSPTVVPPAPTPDTRVAIMDTPSLDQIQVAKDGTYYIADRGDGCVWTEVVRRVDAKLGVQITLGTDCAAGFHFLFRPESGEIFIQLP